MSKQEYLTPQQKHKGAEWKCPTCGEDGAWRETVIEDYYQDEWGNDIPGEVWHTHELYWCDSCRWTFEGHTLEWSLRE